MLTNCRKLDRLTNCEELGYEAVPPPDECLGPRFPILLALIVSWGEIERKAAEMGGSRSRGGCCKP